MTEEEWMTCVDPQAMLVGLRTNPSDRKLHLFACACWRVVLPFFGPRSRAAVEASEAFADGTASRELLMEVWRRLRKPPRTVALFSGYEAALKAVNYTDYYVA